MAGLSLDGPRLDGLRSACLRLVWLFLPCLLSACLASPKLVLDYSKDSNGQTDIADKHTTLDGPNSDSDVPPNDVGDHTGLPDWKDLKDSKDGSLLDDHLDELAEVAGDQKGNDATQDANDDTDTQVLPAVCGDGTCVLAENCYECPTDCGQCQATDGFVIIPPGGFWMGSPDGGTPPQGYPGDSAEEYGRDDSEVLRYVVLTRPFEIALTETTVQQWNEVFPDWTPSGECSESAEPSASKCPVNLVSWYEALAYANKLSESSDLDPCYSITEIKCGSQEVPSGSASAVDECMVEARGGIWSAEVKLSEEFKSPYECKGFRLPTDAEWEKAARMKAGGMSTGSFCVPGALVQNQNGCPPQNPSPIADIAWYCWNSNTKVRPVSSAPGGACPNGLFDVHGNVAEWTWDGWSNLAYQPGEYLPANPIEDPFVSPYGGGVVLRGGGYMTAAAQCRSAKRENQTEPWTKAYGIGFRLVRSL